MSTKQDGQLEQKGKRQESHLIKDRGNTIYKKGSGKQKKRLRKTKWMIIKWKKILEK